MNEQHELEAFNNALHQEISIAADSEDEGEFRLDQFTQVAADYLIESGAVDDIHVCYHKSRGMHMNGYSFSNDNRCINIFVSIFFDESAPVSVKRSTCETALKNALSCFRRGSTGFHRSLEESSETYDAFLQIYELRNEITNCRIFLLTDGIVNHDSFSPPPLEHISVSYDVWDLRRIFRFVDSGRKPDAITIDFESDFDCSLPCLPIHDSESDYEGYLAAIPGKILSDIYDYYGPRLLERNVRTFLQARGKVNRGIRDTILEEPHRFFAYNNGITATADQIEFKNEGIKAQIVKIQNLQIVNGGQTTASLFHTHKKHGANLDGIFVQVKLSVVPERSIEEIVPLISRYANSQNKVNDADFFANDPYHVAIEEFSRTVWAPASEGSSRQSRWFYERARGQYLDMKAREDTPSKKRQFDATWPSKQKFNKTDVAKFENTWAQLPHIVSLGAQKNFNEFVVRLGERGKKDVDQSYFERLVAKAILFKTTDRIVRKLNFGGYKANIVTYTVAFLSNKTSQRIDLESIWNNQRISPTLEEAISDVSQRVFKVLVKPPNVQNVTEWCKKPNCWTRVKKIDWQVPSTLEKELLDLSKPQFSQRIDKGIQSPNKEEQLHIEQAMQVSADVWFSISRWAKETDNLEPWQRGLAYSIGKIVARSGQVSPKQAARGLELLSKAEKLGFNLAHAS